MTFLHTETLDRTRGDLKQQKCQQEAYDGKNSLEMDACFWCES